MINIYVFEIEKVNKKKKVTMIVNLLKLLLNHFELF